MSASEVDLQVIHRRLDKLAESVTANGALSPAEREQLRLLHNDAHDKAHAIEGELVRCETLLLELRKEYNADSGQNTVEISAQINHTEALLAAAEATADDAWRDWGPILSRSYCLFCGHVDYVAYLASLPEQPHYDRYEEMSYERRQIGEAETSVIREGASNARALLTMLAVIVGALLLIQHFIAKFWDFDQHHTISRIGAIVAVAAAGIAIAMTFVRTKRVEPILEPYADAVARAQTEWETGRA